MARKIQLGTYRVQHREIDEAEDAGQDRTDEVDALAAEAIRQRAGDRDGEERDHARRDQRGQQEVTGLVEDLCPVGEDKSEIDVGRRLLSGPRQSRQDDLLGLTLQHLDHGDTLDALLVDYALKCRRLEDAEPDVEPNPDHDDAEHERIGQPQTRN